MKKSLYHNFLHTEHSSWSIEYHNNKIHNATLWWAKRHHKLVDNTLDAGRLFLLTVLGGSYRYQKDAIHNISDNEDISSNDSI